MANFLHFVSADPVLQSRIAPACLPPGLRDALHDAHRVPDEVVVSEVKRGPNDKPGWILYANPPTGQTPRRLGYFPAEQTWRPRPGTDNGAWTGWTHTEPPAPCDLERSEQIDGYHVPDGHGNRWLIPVVRSLENPRGNLPWEISFDDQDQPIFGATHHVKFWNDSATLWDLVERIAKHGESGYAIISQGTTDGEQRFMYGMVVRALSINYRLDPHLIASLSTIYQSMLSCVPVSLMANAIVDMFAHQQWERAKKKESIQPGPAGSRSTPGAPDECQSIAPPEEI